MVEILTEPNKSDYLTTQCDTAL